MLMSVLILAGAIASAASAKPINLVTQPRGFRSQGLSADDRAQGHVRTFDQCYALAIARGFSHNSRADWGNQKRNPFIHNCEVGTQS
jgi:hypothetical protein